MPINEKSLQEHPDDWWDPANAVFNGPYVVEAWTNGADTTLARNPNYVGDGIGNVGTIVLRPFTDPNARLQAFENGEIQFTFLAGSQPTRVCAERPRDAGEYEGGRAKPDLAGHPVQPRG